MFIFMSTYNTSYGEVMLSVINISQLLRKELIKKRALIYNKWSKP